jgi:hypothetical protein
MTQITQTASVNEVTPRQVAAAKALVNLSKRTGKPVEPEITALAADAELAIGIDFSADGHVGRHIDIESDDTEAEAVAGS